MASKLDRAASSKKHDDFWSSNSEGIPIEALFGEKGGSGEIGRRIRAADDDGDGMLTKKEFRSAIEGAIDAAKNSKRSKQGLIVTLVFTVFLLLSIFGLAMAVLELSKQTKMAGDTMLVKGSDEPVQMASTDFAPAIPNGDEGGARGALVKAQDSSIVSTSEALVYAPLTSSRPDEDFAQLKAVTISSGSASTTLRVDGFLRSAPDSKFNTNRTAHADVRLFTSYGSIKLVGDQVQFMNMQKREVLQAAGFKMDPKRSNFFADATALGGYNNIPEEYR